MDKPIGSWLLYLPGTWSILMANYHLHQPMGWSMLGWFGLGAVVMRGAGCTINDLWDRKIDMRVERTKGRPLASGQLSTKQAIIFLGGQLSVGALVLLQMDPWTVCLGSISLLPVTVYPLMKRVTNWPQAMLGLAFNWGALLGWSAQAGVGLGNLFSNFASLSAGMSAYLSALPVTLSLYVAGISWTLLYDTIYAMQDVKDDREVGIGSTALRFGENWRPWLTGFAGITCSSLAMAGWLNGHGAPFWLGLGMGGAQLAWQLTTLNPHSTADCLHKFKSNRWFGLFIAAGISVDVMWQWIADRMATQLTSVPII